MQGFDRESYCLIPLYDILAFLEAYKPELPVTRVAHFAACQGISTHYLILSIISCQKVDDQ